MNRLYETSKYYVDKPGSIKSNTQDILLLGLQAQNDCNYFLYPSEVGDISDECTDLVYKFGDSILKDYVDERFIGDSGEKYLMDIALSLEKQRRTCGIESITRPNVDKDSDCKFANDFLGPLAEKLFDSIAKKELKYYFSYFRLFYISGYRAGRNCKDRKQLK